MHQSNHDTLTDLPNRKYLKELVEEMLTRLKGKNKELALLYIDLDGFKPINDTLGHAAGDILLKELALRLKKIVRGSDIVARLGGDEFVVVLASGVNKSGAGLVAKNILDCIAKPFYLEDDNTPSYVTASIGIAFSKNLSYKELLENGDSAMYEAKHSGKNRFVFFEDIVKK
ncbi:MAG: GGDEF domain-containing protein [Sulfurimonadaceae bacterium]|nr:GGDEF domain-containing protein [Sulfurimonadaceae bacterium]